MPRIQTLGTKTEPVPEALDECI
uniref:Uncharacterized protein n=1 Tax=Anguilla anguilla TaxID=7936 RepID=A0A0E9ULZ4_ANGAN